MGEGGEGMVGQMGFHPTAAFLSRPVGDPGADGHVPGQSNRRGRNTLSLNPPFGLAPTAAYVERKSAFRFSLKAETPSRKRADSPSNPWLVASASSPLATAAEEV